MYLTQGINNLVTM